MHLQSWLTIMYQDDNQSFCSWQLVSNELAMSQGPNARWSAGAACCKCLLAKLTIHGGVRGNTEPPACWLPVMDWDKEKRSAPCPECWPAEKLISQTTI